MKIFNVKYITLFIMLLQISYSFAMPEVTYTTSYISPIYVSGPADSQTYGTLIANSGSWPGLKICNNRDINYTLSRIDYEPITPWTGQTFQETSAHPVNYLFETGVPGFSFTPMGGFSYTTTSFNPLPPKTTTVWKGNVNNSLRISSPKAVTIGVYIYKGPDRIVGSIALPSTIMYRYVCFDETGKAQEAANVRYNTITVNASVTGCEPTTKAMTLDMDKIPASSIENSDASVNIGMKQQTFSLQCDPNIDVFVSVVDLTNTTNKTNIANLTADSTASGVGFVVTNGSGQRYLFGPDGSAANIPGQQKYYLQRTGTADKNNPMSFTLGFSYVRKPGETFKTGSAKAMIGLTYSYQ
ncbi:fimbrial protein [Providencia rettgeri]|uniref:fimbrial protein n=1 Tax=Providencia TaxID=586 RepID=UPI001B37AFFE|nr:MULTISPECIES: fimbrial protein [Providencia]EJD6477733.1 fimbrial protein [Providencia rettgeri]MBQ0343525.1 fimbrial protein [Providencia rettgeri]